MSWVIISSMMASMSLVGFQPRTLLAFAGLPRSKSTSVGRKYLGLTVTKTRPVPFSTPAETWGSRVRCNVQVQGLPLHAQAGENDGKEGKHFSAGLAGCTARLPFPLSAWAPTFLIDSLARPLNLDVLCPESLLHERADGVRLPRCQHEVIGLVSLQHHPHAQDVVLGVAEIALRVEIAKNLRTRMHEVVRA